MITWLVLAAARAPRQLPRRPTTSARCSVTTSRSTRKSCGRRTQKLIEALHELEETRDRYIELYDGAPNGYCTLDCVGVVREINLTGAALLGQSRAALVGTPLLPSIVAADRGRFLGYLQTSAKGTNEATGGEEVHVHTAHGDRTLQLTCRPRHHERAPSSSSSWPWST